MSQREEKYADTLITSHFESKKQDESQSSHPKLHNPKKRTRESFMNNSSAPSTSEPYSDHPLASTDYYKSNPPIPIWNIVIDNETLEIVEDHTGKP